MNKEISGYSSVKTKCLNINTINSDSPLDIITFKHIAHVVDISIVVLKESTVI